MPLGSFYSSHCCISLPLPLGRLDLLVSTFIVNSFSHCGGENEKEEEECIEGEKDQFIENESQQNRGDEK